MALAPETPAIADVFLNPGDFHFHRPALGRGQPVRLRTLLGSCVSVILWHPEHRLGGMSHFILPSRSRPGLSTGLDGRYCDEAIALFFKEVIQAGTLPPQFQVYVVGGGQMHVTGDRQASVGTRNVEAARSHLKKAGFVVRADHVFTDYHRKVELDLLTGVVTVICNNQHFNLTVK